MPVTLLKISPGLASLEFDDADWDAVRSEACRRFGDITVEKRGLDDVVVFGGERFTCSILEIEPHLMAGTARGIAMLEELASVFGKEGAES